MNSEFMTTIARGVAACGFLVCRFNFPYMEARRRTPDGQAVLEACFRSVVDGLVEVRGRKSLVIGGKSLGGRIASHVVGDTPAVGLLFLGYPLHPPGKPQRLRTSNLAVVRVPMLFIQGSRDPFCSLSALQRFLDTHDGPAEVTVIEGGDHSLKVPKDRGRTPERAWQDVIEAASAWAQRLMAHDAVRRAP